MSAYAYALKADIELLLDNYDLKSISAGWRLGRSYRHYNL